MMLNSNSNSNGKIKEKKEKKCVIINYTENTFG